MICLAHHIARTASACAIGFMLCACAASAPKATLPPVTPIMIPPAMPATAAQDLTGGPWRWAGPEGKPVAPERYTVEFTGDGRVLVLADCNRGSSRYTQEAGGRLTLTPIATTKMACAAGSQDTAFLRQLGAVESYRIDAGVLVLQLGGGETMRLTR